MAEWSVGEGALRRVLYRDGQAVGMLDNAEVAEEIARGMNQIATLTGAVTDAGRQLLGRGPNGAPMPETARERSRASWECPAETWSWWHFTDQQVDAYWIRCTIAAPHEEHEDENTGLRWRTGDRPADAERRSEATPQDDLPRDHIAGVTGCDCTMCRALDASRVDPYDTTKGYPS